MKRTALERPRIQPVKPESGDTLLSAERANDLALAVEAFSNLRAGPGITNLFQKEFHWKPLEAGDERTLLNRPRSESLFDAVNQFSRKTGTPRFVVDVAGADVLIREADAGGGSQVVKPLEQWEHLLQAGTANRLIDAVNRVWRAKAVAPFSLKKARGGWMLAYGVEVGFCTYDPEYNKPGIPQWEVLNGTLDLIGTRPPDGPSLEDLIPGTGMYWDLVGTTDPTLGILQCVKDIALVAGHDYTLSAYIAGNQRFPFFDKPVLIRLGTLDGGGVAQGDVFEAEFTPVSPLSYWEQVFWTFTPGMDYDQVRFNFRTIGPPAQPRIGCLIDNVYLKDETTGDVLLWDDFNGRYHCDTGEPWDEPYFIP